MTNDRRKTFNTAEEFLLWTLASATNKRKARDTEGNLWSAYLIATRLHYITYGERVGQLAASGAGMESHLFPLTAVEDEHGAIEEQKIDALANSIALIGCISKEEVASILTAIRKEIDERIAAASVERFKLWEDKKKWCWDCDYRLKPKGDK